MGSVSNVLPICELLEGRQLLSAGLLPEVLSTAAPIDVPAIGETSISGQVDVGANGFFTVTAKSKGRMIIDALGQGGTDTCLRVYSSSGRLVASNNNASRYTHDSRVKLNLREGATVYVQVSGYRGSVGAYSVRINSQPADDRGNTMAAASRWRLSGTGSGALSGVVNYAGDVDFLSVVAPVSGRMQVSMVPYWSAQTDGELAVYNSSGTLIASDDNSGGGKNPLLGFDVQAGQTYFLKVFTHDGLRGDYVLRSAIQKIVAPPAGGGGSDPSGGGSGGGAAGVTIVAGAAISAQIVNGTQLLVLGTDQADVITLSQSGDTITLTTSAGSQNFQGSFTSIVVYGFGGNDTIRLTNSVAVGATIYGGTGNDSLFDNACSAATVYGGDGDDLIVTIGAIRDTVYGEGGLDSAWLDGTDTMMDAASAETAVGAIHRVAQFYQPYSTDTTSLQYVPLSMAGQNFTDPTASGTYANFASLPLFANGPDFSDIRQGGVGDCYYLASIASLTQTDPGLVRQMIAPMGDGTYAVRFFRAGREVYLRLDADLPTYGGSQLVYAKLSSQSETWVPMLEKAYAYFRKGQNSYASISAGWMATVYAELTGASTSTLWTDTQGSSAVSFISSQLGAGHAVTAGSKSGSASPVVGCHAYMVKAVEITSSGTFVTVYNPWGTDGVTYDSNPSDGLVRMPLSTFLANFDGIVASMA